MATTTKKSGTRKTETAKTDKKTPAKEKNVKKPVKPIEEMPEDIWEQFPDETGNQYAQFCAYRDMAYQDGRRLNKRSLRKLAKQLNLKAARPLEQLSQKYGWVNRCEAYDLEIDRKAREAQEAAIIKMRKDHADVAAQIVKKATKRLLTMPDEEISPADLVRLFDTGVKIERLSRGETTCNAKISGATKVSHEGSISLTPKEINLSDLSDEEVRQLEQLLGKVH